MGVVSMRGNTQISWEPSDDPEDAVRPHKIIECNACGKQFFSFYDDFHGRWYDYDRCPWCDHQQWVGKGNTPEEALNCAP